MVGLVAVGPSWATSWPRDLLAFGGIVVELKAVAELVSEHEAPLFNCIRIARQSVDCLIDFGHESELRWKRYILSDLHRRHHE